MGQLRQNTRFRVAYDSLHGTRLYEYFKERYDAENFKAGWLHDAIKASASVQYTPNPMSELAIWGPCVEMPAFRIHRSDGTSYVTNMSVSTTLKVACDYFMPNGVGVKFTEEVNGKEYSWTVTKVEAL